MKKTRIGEMILVQRTALHLTSVELATKLNCTAQFICNWEKGRSSPPRTMLTKLSKVLKIPVEDLIMEMCRDYADYLSFQEYKG